MQGGVIRCIASRIPMGRPSTRCGELNARGVDTPAVARAAGGFVDKTTRRTTPPPQHPPPHQIRHLTEDDRLCSDRGTLDTQPMTATA
jgi:hypothetical protein